MKHMRSAFLRIWPRSIAALMAILLCSSVVVVAADSSLYSPPNLPKAKGPVSQTSQCVEPVEVMRHQHMQLIKHQRDLTMHQGIRGTQHSLVGCINCHATPGADGKAVGADSPDHFCSSCHRYAAVSIDCFQCHADKPAAATETVAPLVLPPVAAEPAAVKETQP